MSTGRRTSLKDVAFAAGVSLATASLILNDKTDSFAPATIDRVRTSAHDLSYRPNAVAQSLRSKRTHTIGLLSDTIATTPFAGATIRGSQEAAWKSGHVLVLIDTEGDPDVERAAVDAFLERQVDGLLYARMHHEVVNVPDELAGIPVTLLDARDTSDNYSSVVPDEAGGARTAVAHLAAAGHTRIAFVQSSDPFPAAKERLVGYQQALDDAGLPYDPRLVVFDDPSNPRAPATVTELLTRQVPPTGVFCFNDRIAFGVYNVAHRVGLSIPHDLSVVGFDNQETVADWLDPGLTTIQLPHYEMGRWAVEELERQIRAESTHPIHHRMPCPLVERHSVAPPQTKETRSA